MSGSQRFMSGADPFTECDVPVYHKGRARTAAGGIMASPAPQPPQHQGGGLQAITLQAVADAPEPGQGLHPH